MSKGLLREVKDDGVEYVSKSQEKRVEIQRQATRGNIEVKVSVQSNEDDEHSKATSEGKAGGKQLLTEG